jgi:hypothetical protein
MAFDWGAQAVQTLRPTHRSIPSRTRSSTGFTISAPSRVGSISRRKGGFSPWLSTHQSPAVWRVPKAGSDNAASVVYFLLSVGYYSNSNAITKCLTIRKLKLIRFRGFRGSRVFVRGWRYCHESSQFHSSLLSRLLGFRVSDRATEGGILAFEGGRISEAPYSGNAGLGR